jgi:WSC domain
LKVHEAMDGLQVHTTEKIVKSKESEKEPVSTVAAFSRESAPDEREWAHEQPRGPGFQPTLSRPVYAPHPERHRICGLRKTTFWLALALIAFIIAAAAGGAAGGVLASKKNKSNSASSQQTQTATVIISGSATSTVRPSGTTSATTPSTKTSGAPLPTTTVDGKTLGPWAYQGCWIDNDDPHRTLNGNSTHNSGMTNELCAGYCSGYTYFGTETRELPNSPVQFVCRGRKMVVPKKREEILMGRCWLTCSRIEYQCFCGNTIDNGAILSLNQSACNAKCLGDDTTICGGDFHLSLWMV